MVIRYFLLSLLLSVNLFAQDTIPKVKVPAIPLREDQLIINLTLDNWSGLPSNVESKPFRSRGFSFLLMTDKVNNSGNLGIGAGVGFMSQNVHTDAYIADTGSASFLSPIPDSMKYEINKLSSNYITAALELRIRSNENGRGERFKLNIGMIAGFLVQSHVKYEDKYGKLKTYDIAHLNKFQYGVEARLGYNNVALFGYYSLVPVFKDGKGPEMNPYSIGISFTL
jgi:hypothetical protein